MKMKLTEKFLIILMCHFLPQEVSASEQAVLNYILQDYDPRVRPVKNISTQTTVSLSIQIIRLIEVNTQQEYIKLSMTLDQNWHDEYLTWNPDDFNGTAQVYAPRTSVWVPDTTIITTSFENENIADPDRLVVFITADGTAATSYPFVLSNYCEMKTDDFPYDMQECLIKIASWNFDIKQLIMKPSAYTAEPQFLNSEWDIMPFTYDIYDLNLAPELTFRQALYTLPIKRKPAYYFWVAIMPTLVITALSIAGMFAPMDTSGDRGEKLTFGLTTLLTLAVILSMVTADIPRTTNVPLLGKFVLFEIIITVICMSASVLILFVHHRAATRCWDVPLWLDKLLACDFKRVIWRRDETPVVPVSPHPHPSPRAIYGIDKTKNFKFQSETTKLKGISEYNDAVITPLDEVIAKVKDCIDKKEIEKRELEIAEKRKERWMHFFDHIDMLLFVGLEVAHAATYLIWFHRSY